MGRLVAVNPRGVGGSSGTAPQDFTFRRHVDDLEAVRKHLGIDRWVFWGSSGGGAIALLYALTYPRSLSAVIIDRIVPSARRLFADDRSTLSPRFPDYQSDLQRPMPSAHHAAILHAVNPQLATAEWLQLREDRWLLCLDSMPLLVSGAGAPRQQAALEEFATVLEVQERLGEIKIPTLLVMCRRDELFPVSHGDVLRKGIPHAEYVVLDESKHSVDAASADGAKLRAAAGRFLANLPMRRAQ
jgi:proline iminopeptidase